MKDKKKIVLIAVFAVAIFLVSFFVYKLANADSAANSIAMNNVKIMGISTGTEAFSDDGFDYSDPSSYQRDSGYVAGNDSNENNRIIRSFDKLTYHFNFSISSKVGNLDYESRKVVIKVILPDAIKDYIAFDENSVAGEKTHEYVFDGIDTYGDFNRDVDLYVLGAPNGTSISPTFEIQESSNIDQNYVVTLGNKNSSEDYEYEKESNTYRNTSSVTGFTNYMPTIVSSKTANARFRLIPQSTEGQKATYDSKNGRFLSYILSMELVGNDSTGIKGYTMLNKENVNFNISYSQDSSSSVTFLNNDWVRLYGTETVSSIEPVVVSLPYSSSSGQKTKYPGDITSSTNNVAISNYNFAYTPVKVNADGSSISNSTYVIGTYAFTVFSQREAADGKDDITNTLTINGTTVKDTAGTNISVPTVSSSLVNKYFEESDNSLTGELFNEDGSKLSDNKGLGSASKGTTLIYRTTFDYKQTNSNQGLKEYIKVDPNAFRVLAYGNEDVKITVTSPNKNFKSDDFDVKFISGDFNNANYTISNSFNNISNEERSIAESQCSSISLSSLTNDQVMNLYGGPCIKANANTETVYSKISDAKTSDNKEVPISKIVIETKDGIKLPDSVNVTVEIKVRVRNIKDITQNYQIVSSASSDSEAVYYSPRVTGDENSVTSPDNYRKTVYYGPDNAVTDQDSPWGDSIKVVNFTSRQVVSVTNKNSDGSMKTNYNVANGETLHYNIKTIINDNNMQVGADDVWYINKLRVYVTLPSTLDYIPNKDLGEPVVINNTDSTVLIYELPYTKPNMAIKDINFNAKIKSNIKGTGVSIIVNSTADAININGEKDTSYFANLYGSLEIFATGINNVIVSQKVGNEGSVVEKNSEFSYLLGAYNNTNNNITDYALVDVLPSNNDVNSSKFSGDYMVKVVLPNTIGDVSVTCSKVASSKLKSEVFNENNGFEQCDVLNSFVQATAIRISGIKINANRGIDDIRVIIRPVGNNYSDKYVNKFVGGSRTYSQTESNEIEVRVVSRSISGRVFVDSDEDGIETKGDTYLKDIPVTIYKLDSDNNITKIGETVTNEKGEYKFKDLDEGRYKVRANYDNSKYDLTLRYATQDTAVDSDAYKLSDGLAEISNKKTPDESDGIRVTREVESIENMNIGLINRRSFGFDIDKFITRVDLTYNGTTNTTNYNNAKVVKIDVNNTLRATSKVYYGIKISNNSTSAGYVKLINESIPLGSVFDESDEINKGWFYSNGELKNISLENDLIMPGETRYLQIALKVPSQAEARNYINTVTILDVEKYENDEAYESDLAQSSIYNLGEAISYAGENWHVINVKNNGDDQLITLLADSSPNNIKLGHTSSANDIYKWSTSNINNYINGQYLNENNLDVATLVPASICDDASGLPVASYGGSLEVDGTCQSGQYNSYNVRLLTEKEFIMLKTSGLSDLSWLYGDSDFWLQNSFFLPQDHDLYGRLTEETNVKNLAKYVDKSTSSVRTGYDENMSRWVKANTAKQVRPVITVSSNNILGAYSGY